MADFTAPKKDQYLKLDSKAGTHKLVFLERLADHEEFTLGKGKKAVPAPVWKVTDKLTGESHRLSITSTQLHESLENVKRALGRLEGIEVHVTPLKEGKEREYKVTVPDEIAAPAQQTLG